MTMPDHNAPSAEQAQANKTSLIQNDITHPSVTTLSQLIIDALRGLNTIVQLALSENTAQYEARQQLSALAHNLGGLAQQSLVELSSDAPLKAAWQSLVDELGVFVLREEAEETDSDADSDEEEESTSEADALSEQEISRRLGIGEPSYHSEALGSGQELRRVLVASLETQGDTPMLVAQAAGSFARETWQVTNLGATVPIMALTGIVMDSRPSVLVLIIGQGQLLAETARLILDLKRQLFGLRIIAVGPILSQPGLAARLQLDLYSSSPEKAAELADQFFSPLTKLGDRLQLSLELSNEEMLPGFVMEPAENESTEPEAEG